MIRRLTLALSLAVLSVVSVESAPTALREPNVAMAQVSLPPMVVRPARIGGKLPAARAVHGAEREESSFVAPMFESAG